MPPDRPTTITPPPDPLAGELRRSGFVHIAPGAWRALIGPAPLAGWTDFAASWERLDPDRWMGDGGTYRRRRFAAFAVGGDDIRRKPHQPHFQDRAYNPLNGGVDRWFSAVEPAIGDHPFTRALLATGGTLADRLTDTPGTEWHVEMHQFRILAQPGETASPTPEGLHRDGVAAVLMMLVGRDNITGGISQITDPAGRVLARIALAEPLEAIVLDDRRLRHAVSPIRTIDPDRPGRRDVLVLTFRHMNGVPA